MFKENLVFVGSEEEVRKEHRKVVEVQGWEVVVFKEKLVFVGSEERLGRSTGRWWRCRDGRWWCLKRTLCL